jgi:hypothetical protein
MTTQEAIVRLKDLQKAMEEHWQYLKRSTYHPFLDERAFAESLKSIINEMEE